MWVNITLKDMDVDGIVSVLKNLYDICSDTLILTFNTSKAKIEVEKIIEGIVSECKAKNIPISFGPQFFADSCVINGEDYFVSELFLTTPGERMLWYMFKHKADFRGFSQIALLDGLMGIDPLIIMNKSNKLEGEHQFYFCYGETSIDGLESLVKGDNYHFMRIRGKKGEGFDNDN